MPWIFRYFWFICAAFMLVNIVIWQRRLAVVVEHGNATKPEMDRFIRWVSLCLIGGPLLLGIVGLGAGWSSPLCSGIMSFADMPRATVSMITLSGWAGLLWWVWRGNGADFLARVAPAFRQRPSYDKSYSRSLVRFAVTAMVLVGGVGSVITWRTTPMPPEIGCHVAVAG
jgi:hypothetical protein